MPSENKDRASKPPALEPPPNPRPTASNAPTPLGTLSTLPRELRDEIYRHVHDHEYYTSDCMGEDCHKWCSQNGESLGLPMMTLSKAIRQEFLAVFFGEAVFVLENVEHAGGTIWIRELIPCIDQILNVRYVASLFLLGRMSTYKISRIFRDSRLVKKVMSKSSAKPVEFFTGTEVLRNSCSIELRSGTPTVMPVFQSPLIMAIKGLTGFKIVTLKLTSDAWRWSRDEARIVNGGNLSDADYAEEFRGMANAFRSALEPSLGPSIISEDCDKGLAWELTFRPRDYVANRNKEKAISSSLGDEGNGSFSQVGNS